MTLSMSWIGFDSLQRQLLIKEEFVNKRLGRPAKEVMAEIISKVIKEKGLTQHQAAAITGWTQERICKVCNGKLRGFSLEKMFQALNRLGYDIEIRITDRGLPGSQGSATIVFNGEGYAYVSFSENNEQ